MFTRREFLFRAGGCALVPVIGDGSTGMADESFVTLRASRGTSPLAGAGEDMPRDQDLGV